MRRPMSLFFKNVLVKPGSVYKYGGLEQEWIDGVSVPSKRRRLESPFAFLGQEGHPNINDLPPIFGAL